MITIQAMAAFRISFLLRSATGLGIVFNLGLARADNIIMQPTITARVMSILLIMLRFGGSLTRILQRPGLDRHCTAQVTLRLK
jgi:hypothetical protein